MIWIILFVVVIVLIIFSSKKPVSKNQSKYIKISSKDRQSIVSELKGVHLEDRKTYLLNFCNKGDMVSLEFEPENKYDENAIKVIHDGYHIGYIDALDTIEVKEFISNYPSNYPFIYKYEVSGGFVYVEIGLIEK